MFKSSQRFNNALLTLVSTGCSEDLTKLAALQFTQQMQDLGLFEADQGWFDNWARSDTGQLPWGQ